MIASTEPCTSPLTTMLRSWTSPACSASNRFSSDTPDLGRTAKLLAAETLGALLREVAGLTVVLDDAAELAGGRRLVEAEDLDRVAGLRVVLLLALVVVERAHLAPGVSGDDSVADAERPALDEHGRDGPASDVQPRLDDRPGGVGLRVRRELELGVGDEQHLLEQLVEVGLLARRDVGRSGSSPPHSSGWSPSVVRSPSTRSVFASGRSTLFTATTIGTCAARACAIDSRVCGMTPSSAATTSTAMSVTFAPRARMAVNASWPGVSRNVTLRPSTSTW